MPVMFTVTALDATNATATSYVGTVHFTSSDSAAVLPADATLTAGVGTFSATLKTAGSQTISATDTVTSSVTGTSNPITVTAAAATHFFLSAPTTATAGAPLQFTVTALDSFGNTATTYAGTVHFAATFPTTSTLPADSTLTAGSGTFSATFKTAGTQVITAADTTNSINGASNEITVAAAAATHFTVTAPTAVATGTAFSFSVTAQDSFNNTASGYSGTVHFSSSDSAASLPADATLTAGTGSFNATLNTAGAQSLTATDNATSSITGSAAVTVGKHHDRRHHPVAMDDGPAEFRRHPGDQRRHHPLHDHQPKRFADGA